MKPLLRTRVARALQAWRSKALRLLRQTAGPVVAILGLATVFWFAIPREAPRTRELVQPPAALQSARPELVEGRESSAQAVSNEVKSRPKVYGPHRASTLDEAFTLRGGALWLPQTLPNSYVLRQVLLAEIQSPGPKGPGDLPRVRLVYGPRGAEVPWLAVEQGGCGTIVHRLVLVSPEFLADESELIAGDAASLNATPAWFRVPQAQDPEMLTLFVGGDDICIFASPAPGIDEEALVRVAGSLRPYR